MGWGELPELGTLPQGAARQLWDKVGLGGSQKGEVAYLQRMGYAYTRLDVMDGAPTADEAGALLAARAREMEGALRGAIAGAGAARPPARALLEPERSCCTGRRPTARVPPARWTPRRRSRRC